MLPRERCVDVAHRPLIHIAIIESSTSHFHHISLLPRFHISLLTLFILISFSSFSLHYLYFHCCIALGWLLAAFRLYYGHFHVIFLSSFSFICFIISFSLSLFYSSRRVVASEKQVSRREDAMSVNRSRCYAGVTRKRQRADTAVMIRARGKICADAGRWRACLRDMRR